MDDASKKATGIAVGLGSGVGLLWGLNPEMIQNFLSETAQSQIAQAGFFFTLAAWIHAGRVKKEIAKHFSSLTIAINNVALTLRQDLDAQKKVLEDHGGRIQNLEIKKQGG